MKNKKKNIIYWESIRQYTIIGILLLLTLGLTILSLEAQYHFWQTLFGTQTAIIAACVFEILRLASLYDGMPRTRSAASTAWGFSSISIILSLETSVRFQIERQPGDQKNMVFSHISILYIT